MENLLKLTQFNGLEETSFILINNNADYKNLKKLESCFNKLGFPDYKIINQNLIDMNDILTHLNLNQSKRIIVLPLEFFSSNIDIEKINILSKEIKKQGFENFYLPINFGEIKPIQELFINKFINSRKIK